MYHIKQDKRSKASANLIVEGLYQCLDTKKFPDITISDLQRITGVGRSTFYRLFDNLTDVLEYECDNAFRTMLERYHQKELTLSSESRFDSLMLLLVNYWMGHPQLLNAITDSRRIDILNTVFMNHVVELGTILAPSWKMSETELRYFVSVASSALFGVFNAWVKGRKKENSTELLSSFKRAITMVSMSVC